MSALRYHIAGCTETLTAQAMGSALYGLQSMRSDSPDIQNLLIVLRLQFASSLLVENLDAKVRS